MSTLCVSIFGVLVFRIFAVLLLGFRSSSFGDFCFCGFLCFGLLGFVFLYMFSYLELLMSSCFLDFDVLLGFPFLNLVDFCFCGFLCFGLFGLLFLYVFLLPQAEGINYF